MNVLLGQSECATLARRALKAPRRPTCWCDGSSMTAVPLVGADAVSVRGEWKGAWDGANGAASIACVS